MRLLRPVLSIPVITLALLGLTGCGASTAPADEGSGEETTTAAEAEAPAIGAPVRDGDIEFVVNSVSCTTEPMSDDTFAPLAPSGQFCKINVSATALAEIGMYLGKITIDTVGGDEGVSPAPGATMYAGTLSADYIDAGQTLQGDVVFDVALDDSVASVVLRENPLTEGVRVPVTP